MQVRIAIVILGLFTAGIVQAETTYRYVGNDFLSTFAPCSPGDRVEISFTLAEPIPPSSPIASRSVTSYSFEACGDSCTSESPCPEDLRLFQVGTDASGVPNDWLVRIEWNVLNSAYSGILTHWIEPGASCAGPPIACGGDQRFGSGIQGRNDVSAGSWTVTSPPVVPSLSRGAALGLASIVLVTAGAWLRRIAGSTQA